MRHRTPAWAAFGAVLLFVMGVPTHAGGSPNHASLVTFSAPVRLPGVTLDSGSYIFELAAPRRNPDVVTVTNVNRSIVYYAGFTREVERPHGQTQAITLSEAVTGGVPQVLAWYPDGEASGQQFLYKARRGISD